MKKAIAEGVWLFLDDDEAFIRCCRDNPKGYFWNCGRTTSGEISQVYTLHRAERNGDLCPHFKDKRTSSGYAANLTTTGCKVFSTHRKALDATVRKHRGRFGECADCMK